jgi:CheY-like chemotaxis protein
MAHYLRLVLSRDGYDVAAAFNAEDAWALFRREAPRVRAVVTDIRMPGGPDGLELARRVRQAAPNTPVLLVTGYPPSEPLGPNCSLLLKPFRADALRAAVGRMVEAGASLVAADAGALGTAGRDGEPHPDRKRTATRAVSTDQPRNPA